MNQVQEPEQLDLESLRQRAKAGNNRQGNPQQAAIPAKTVKINALARQVARQFQEGSYTPNLIVGQLRLLEFLALVAMGLAMHYFFDALALYRSPMAIVVIVMGSATGAIVLHLTYTYDIPALRNPIKTIPRVLIIWAAAQMAAAQQGLAMMTAIMFGSRRPAERAVKAVASAAVKPYSKRVRANARRLSKTF